MMKRTIPRTAVRLLFLAAVVAAAAAPVPPRIGAFLARCDPLPAGAALLAGRLTAACLGGLAVLLVSLVARRFFCRWLCPLGLLQDGAAGCAKKFPLAKRIPSIKKIQRRWSVFGKIFLLAGLLAVLFGGIGWLWLDSTAIIGSVLAHGTRGFLFDFFIVILIAAVVTPRCWCRTLCPSGALSDLLFALGSALRRPRKKGEVAPGESFSQDSPASDSFSSDSSPDNGRRRFFRGALKFGVIGALGVALAEFGRRAAAFVRRPIRPPGAADEALFMARCLRCGACTRHCPTGVLNPIRSNAAQIDTPAADFSLGWCDDGCHICAESCPTGAISLLTPEKREKTVIAAIRFERDGCRLWYDRECTVCGRECPREAIRFVWNEEEYLNLPEIDAAGCNGCGRCVYLCPGHDGRKGLRAEPIEPV